MSRYTASASSSSTASQLVSVAAIVGGSLIAFRTLVMGEGIGTAVVLWLGLVLVLTAIASWSLALVRGKGEALRLAVSTTAVVASSYAAGFVRPVGETVFDIALGAVASLAGFASLALARRGGAATRRATVSIPAQAGPGRAELVQTRTDARV
jgi:hypothetical protein